MPKETSRSELEAIYSRAADRALQRGTLEVFGETTAQGQQRTNTLASFDLVSASRPEIQVFNELLVRYPRSRSRSGGEFTPDNMVVVHPAPIKAIDSFDLAEQPVKPYLVLDYVVPDSLRKDYDDNQASCDALKVPYYLLFQPDVQELTLYRHNGRRYVSVKPNANERYAIPELELEVAILDEWVRFWFRGELLPLPADLFNQLNEAKRELAAKDHNLADERRARLAAEEENARLRAEIKRLRSGTPRDSAS